jgi:imidazolonepropionase-like amidohydrolase
LRAATIEPAAFFGLEREVGAVKTGYRADLVLLEGDPLQDIRNTRKIAGVIRNGAWIDRAMLDALLARAASDAQH